MAYIWFDWGKGADNYGTEGWVPRWQKKTADGVLEGRVAAHDALEHLFGIGDEAQEVQSFGAVIFGRYHMGMLRGNDQDLADEIINQVEYMEPEDLRRSKRRRVGRDAREMIQPIIDLMHSNENPLWNRKKHKRLLMLLLADGFYKAKKRYGDPTTMTNLFMQIEHEFDRISKHGGEGESLMFHVSIKDGMLLDSRRTDIYDLYE